MNEVRTYKFFAIALVAITACGCTSAKKKEDVWNQYDLRHPVPVDSQVPVSEAVRLQQYIDNDAYYTPPKGYQDND